MATTPPGGYMTKAQFLTTKAAKRGGTYTGYKQYVTNYRTKKAAAEAAERANAVTSFSATPPGYLNAAQLNQQAQGYFPQDAALAALNPTQLQQTASGLVNPVFQQQLDAIKSLYKGRAQAGTNAITGYTNSYVNSLAPIQANVAGIYDQAKQEQANVTASLANFIRDQGSSLQGQLQAQEAGAGQTSAGSDILAGVGAGASGATAAYGQSSLGRLIGEGAATKAYTAQLPAFGRALGTQTLGNFQAQLAGDLNEQVTDINSQLPQALQNAYQTLLDREIQKASGRQTQQTNRANYVTGGLDRNAALQAAFAQIYQNAQSGADTAAANAADAAAAAAAGTTDENAMPTTPAEWAQYMSKDTDLLYGYVSQAQALKIGKIKTVTPAGKVIWEQKPKTWGQMRGQITNAVKLKFPGVPPGILKTYVDRILMTAGWVPQTKKGKATPPTMRPPYPKFDPNQQTSASATGGGAPWWSSFIPSLEQNPNNVIDTSNWGNSLSDFTSGLNTRGLPSWLFQTGW